MPTAKRKVDFYVSEEGLFIVKQLHAMAADDKYKTDASYSANGMAYSDHVIPFVDKHMQYLVVHPSVDPHQYLANLRLMTKIR